MRRRAFRRQIKRLECEFYFGDRTFKGISSNLSERGLFIRTKNSLEPGSPLDITIYLPDDKKAMLKGLVRRSIKVDSVVVKNGMGIEIIEYDREYFEFLSHFLEEDFKAPPLLTMSDEGIKRTEYEKAGRDEELKQAASGFHILKCPECGVKNKIPASMMDRNPICGKCRQPLLIE